MCALWADDREELHAKGRPAPTNTAAAAAENVCKDELGRSVAKSVSGCLLCELGSLKLALRGWKQLICVFVCLLAREPLQPLAPLRGAPPRQFDPRPLLAAPKLTWMFLPSRALCLLAQICWHELLVRASSAGAVNELETGSAALSAERASSARSRE